MKVCAISFKECWRDISGRWYSSGGFPLQMAAIGSLFDGMTLLITECEPTTGGSPLPDFADIVPLLHPSGQDARRKLSVLLHLPYYLNILFRYVRQADVVHCPLPGDIPFLGMLVALVLRKRLLVRYCGSWFPTRQTTLMNRVTRGMMRIFAGGRNVMLATGDYPQPPAKNIHWIFVSVISHAELTHVPPLVEHGLSVPPQLVYVGRLSTEKGVHILIQAVSQLQREGFQPMPVITLIGDGPQHGILEHMVRDLNLIFVFVFRGQLDRDGLLKELPQADLCVLPSLTESYGKARLEAMMCGLPVLTTDVGSAYSIIGRNGERGWVVPPGDVQGLVTALRRVLSEPLDWFALRKNCRLYVEGRTLEAWAQQIGQICVKQWNLYWNEGKLSQ